MTTIPNFAPLRRSSGQAFRENYPGPRAFDARIICTPQANSKPLQRKERKKGMSLHRAQGWNNQSSMSFIAASYNVLASAYIQRAWYRRTPALVLDPAWRVPALVQHICKLNADLFCLQEVEPETFVALRTFLGERGYGGEYARKLAGRPEGLAVFYRRARFDWIGSRIIAYADGAGVVQDTGYIAQVAMLRNGDKTLGVINTHLTWDPPNTGREVRRGLRQVQQCLTEYQSRAADASAWIISGDFNVTAESEIVAVVLQTGLQFAHHTMSDVSSCNIGGSARLIDYLFYSRGLYAEASVVRRIDGQTILPSAEEPSDHIAIMARFDWQD
jgi:mRNA deadenylase 3'-5' endonuclease subunit Ccr4